MLIPLAIIGAGWVFPQHTVFAGEPSDERGKKGFSTVSFLPFPGSGNGNRKSPCKEPNFGKMRDTAHCLALSAPAIFQRRPFVMLALWSPMTGREVEIKNKFILIHKIRGVGGSRGRALQDKTSLQGLAVVERCWPHRALMSVWLLTQHWALAKPLGYCSTLGMGQSLCSPAWETLTAAGSTSRPESWIQVQR